MHFCGLKQSWLRSFASLSQGSVFGARHLSLLNIRKHGVIKVKLTRYSSRSFISVHFTHTEHLCASLNTEVLSFQDGAFEASLAHLLKTLTSNASRHSERGWFATRENNTPSLHSAGT